MAAPKLTLDQVDITADTLMESMEDVQKTMASLHSTVGELINSMAEMKAALEHTTESKVTVEQDLPASPEKQSIAVESSVEEKESRYTYLKKIQIEMPVFDGINVDSWIPRAERYLEIGSFTETEKLRLVYLSVDGEALSWFNFWNRREPFLDWNDFKSRLLDRFGDFDSGSVFERLLALKQVESVILYLAEFEKLASQSLDVSDDHLETLFFIGLKDEIKNMFNLFQAKGLNDKIKMARRLENTCFCRLTNLKN